MVKLFIGLGVLIFFAGAAAVGLGLPYVVLERGFTQVIVGTVGMNAGLVLIGIGVVLREIRKGRVAATAAATPAAAVDAPQPEAGSIAPLATAAAAGAAAAGLAVAASTNAEAASDKLTQPEFDWPKLDQPAAVPEPTLNLPKFELPPLDMPKLDLPKFDLPKFDLPKLGLPAVDETPLVDTAGLSDVVPGQDEFSRLRAALSDQLERPDSVGADVADAPEIVPVSEVDDQEEDVEVEQPTSEGAPDTAPDAAAIASEDEAEEELATPEPEVVEAETEEPQAKQPEPAREVVSDEGVVRAYQVGDTAFTVYGDGTIRAETREGEYTFQSMEEVRAFLAQEKLKVKS
ncbi:MAG: hypothetical protein ACRC56_08400 [Bosea sp. (in: a-proteobacteria)]